MADMKIEDATRDTEVSGAELLPISDGGVAKSLSTETIKDWVISRIEAIEASGSVDVSSDKAYILRNGTMKPVAADKLAAAILDYGFSLAAIVSPNGNEKFAITDNGTKKSISLDQIKAWVESEAEIDIVDLDDHSSPVETDASYLVIDQGTAGNPDARKISVGDLSAIVLGMLEAYVGALYDASSINDSDVIYVVQGGVERKATIGAIKSALGGGDVLAPANHVPGNIPAWDNQSKKLTSGYPVTNTVDVLNPSPDKIPTEAAVANAIDGTFVIPPASKTIGNIPAWGSGNALTGGYGMTTTLSPSTSASDTKIPTERAVRTAVDGFVQMPSIHNEDAIPQWGAGSELKSGKAVTTAVRELCNASDDAIPTEAAVAAKVRLATSENAGIMSASDKAKLDGMIDLTAVGEVGDTGIGDSDTVSVKKNDTTWKKALMTRFWKYISGKLPTYKIDDFAAGDDNTDLDSSTGRHGLLRKLDNDVTHFLRGDGSWAEPTGSVDFTGDTGSGGVHGLVPAPAAGDASQNKFLCADGNWAVTPAAAGVDIPGSGAVDSLAGEDAFYLYDASTGEYRNITAANLANFCNGFDKYDTLFVPAGAFTPSGSAGVTISSLNFTNNTHDVVNFISGSDTSAEFNCVLPEDWDGGSVKVKVLWTCNSSSAEAGQTVAFTIGSIGFADGENITNPVGEEAAVSDSLIAVNFEHVTDASAGIVAAGTAAGGNLLHFRLMRDVSEGTMPYTALVLGVLVQYRRSGFSSAW